MKKATAAAALKQVASRCSARSLGSADPIQALEARIGSAA